MDHNGLYTDLDSFTSITNLGTTNNSFSSDTCPTLPSLNNFKYQPTNLSTNIYQQPVQTGHDTQQSNGSAKQPILPQTQININNCNNNIFFPHDDGIFDANTATTCASTNTIPNGGQKSNFGGHARKELGPIASGGDNLNPLKNVYFNINNINTNIVNNIQNPTNFANGTDIFGGNQYHQINKNGETIINFTNNNLNNAGSSSMPADTVSATSQNYYGYQSNSSQGQQTSVFETSVQSQSQSQSQGSSYQEPSKSSMGTTGAGLYHGHHHTQGSLNQTMTNGPYLSGNTNTIPPELSATTVDPFSEYPETLSTAKILNNFESKNPLKYPTGSRAAGAYSKSYSEYPQYGHLPHNYPGLYQPTNGIPQQAIPKIPPTQHYEPYPRIPRNTAPHYPQAQHYATPPNAHAIDVNYNRNPAVPVHPPYHHQMMPHPSNSYGNYYTNGYNTMPYSAYQQMPVPPYGNPLIRNESCSKSTSNYNKTGAVALSPVEHAGYPHGTNYAAPPKKDFYAENHYYPMPHPYYVEDPVASALNSCAKKPSSRAKVSADIYNPNGATTLYPDHHSMPHHPQNGNVLRNVGYQPLPKPYSGDSAYPMPTNSCDLANPYHGYNYHAYKNNEHQKMTKINPALSAKQFKSFEHFQPLPHPHNQYGHPPQYTTMQAKHPEKIKFSMDLEEQINSSKIPKVPHPSYGYDPHHPHHYYQYHHHIPSRNAVIDNDPKNPNGNQNLRDFLSTWNEIDEDDESGERRATNGPLEDLSEHMERTIMREYNPMFVQKATDSFMSAADVPSNAVGKSQLSELENGIINEGTEKLYVLESIDVPLSELNKYKHLSVINKLPENVVINDKELYADDNSMKFIEEIDLTREKLYKSEFELEFEACQERKMSKPIDEPIVIPRVVEEVVVVSPKKEIATEEIAKKSDSEEKSPKRKTLKVKVPKMKSPEKLPKVKKEKTLKVESKDLRKVRITKRCKKYSLNQRGNSVKNLQSICVDFVNTSAYRNYAREQHSIIDKNSKMKILKDFKKKFNFDGMKRSISSINQKQNHSDLRISSLSLREMCGKLLNNKSRMLEINDDEREDVQSEYGENENQTDDFPSLKELSKRVLSEMDINVVENDYLYSPLSLKELCETFIYSNHQYFLIEEVSNVPKLQDLCKAVLSETNIFINLDEGGDDIFTLDEPEHDVEQSVADDEPIYIVEESSGNVGELFESENLNSFEKSEILRKIQRVASIEDDDEIIRAIGALHRDDDVECITNNNNSDVSNKNISCANENFPAANAFSMSNEEMKLDSEMSFMSFMDDDLLHSVQYEEIVSGSQSGDKATKKIVEILRHKYLNRLGDRQAARTARAILKQSLTYQRVRRFSNAKRREQIETLKLQARAALSKLKESSDCDTFESDPYSDTSPSAILIEDDDDEAEASPIDRHESENESHIDAKDEDDTPAQSHLAFNHEPIFEGDDGDSPVDDVFDNLDAHAELNFPKLPSVFPSINEYKIDRKSSNRSDVKDIYDAKRRKLNFSESLLSIDQMYGDNVEELREERRDSRSHRSSHSSSSSSHHKSSRHHEKRRHHSSRHRHKSSRSRRSRSRERDNGSRNSYHNSSRQHFYKRDQMKHSEAKRLVIPSYKLYDKDLDVKLKIMPFVRIERVDDLVKKYN